MHGNKVKVKDDTADFIVYYPYPCITLAPIKDDIPNEGCQCVSIDPAIKNFALRVERRYKTGYIETVLMYKVDFSKYGNVVESGGTTTVDPQILNVATYVLDSILPMLQDSRIVAIERQMAVNYKSSRIFQHILTYFMLRVTTFRNPCIIIDISPKLKGKILGAPKGLNYNGLKEWSVEKAIEILTWRNDQIGLKIIREHRGKGKTKADDLADTITQMEAWFILIGGISTQPPIDLISNFAEPNIARYDSLQSYLG